MATLRLSPRQRGIDSGRGGPGWAAGSGSGGKMQVRGRELGKWGARPGSLDWVQPVRPSSSACLLGGRRPGAPARRVLPRSVAVVPAKGARGVRHAPFPCVRSPIFVVSPARTISTCPSTSRPASCSVGGGAPAQPLATGRPGPLPHPVANSWEPRGPKAPVEALTQSPCPMSTPICGGAASLEELEGTIHNLSLTCVFDFHVCNMGCQIISGHREGNSCLERRSSPE